jgi:hypothetical protein
MHKQIYQKFLFYLSLLGVAASVLAGFYDVIFGSLFEFCHLIFEVVEMGLDRFIEHLFHTEKRETELIVFYILFVIIGFLIYLVWKILVQMTRRISHHFVNEWTELKTAVVSDWDAISMTNKIIFISVFLLVNYLASFLLF